ncbi:hypothetical protein C0585_03220 [Candidatus Woesearchaeota archaeon]|nr:MAG: hypothetical protein C0585_03220 [Candidatus Woesearchaeota archaeon]
MTNEEQNVTEEELLTVEEMVYGAHDKVDALIELLIEKNVFTEEEYADKLQQILAEYDDGEEADEEDSE